MITDPISNHQADLGDPLNDREATYRKLVSRRLMEELRYKIYDSVVNHHNYRDPYYSATRLAEDIGTNVRYVSAVIRVQFHCNYTTFVNRYRVEEAKQLLVSRRHAERTIEEIGFMAGFAHRQSFHVAFVKYVGETPNAYREKMIENANQNPK